MPAVDEQAKNSSRETAGNAPPTHQSVCFILIGAVLGFGREALADWYFKLHAWLWKREPNPRLRLALRLYLVFTSMIFTVAGILGLLGIVKY